MRPSHPDHERQDLALGSFVRGWTGVFCSSFPLYDLGPGSGSIGILRQEYDGVRQV